MKAIEKEAIAQAISENVKIYGEDYPVQSANQGVYPTEDACESVARYIDNEYTNNPECEKYIKKEYVDECIDAFYKALELQDGDFDESGSTLNSFNDQVKSYLEH
jgi:hypothetical protein